MEKEKVHMRKMRKHNKTHGPSVSEEKRVLMLYNPLYRVDIWDFEDNHIVYRKIENVCESNRGRYLILAGEEKTIYLSICDIRKMEISNEWA